MQDRTKQRLIGILILLGALFIILPFLFHNARPSFNTAIAQTAKSASSAVSVTLPPDNATLANSKTTGIASATTTTPSDSSLSPSETITTDSADENSDTVTAQHVPTHAITTAAVTLNTAPTVVSAPLTLATHTLAQPLSSHTFTPDQSVSTTSGLTTGAPSGQPAGTVPVTLPVSQAVTATQTESLNQTAVTAPIATPSRPAVPVVTSVPTTTTMPTSITRPTSTAIVPTPAKIKPLVHVKHKQRVVQGGWSVQLAAFADRKNAEALLAKLHARHFRAYTRTLNGREKLILVFAGPERTEYEARWVQQRLKQDFHLSGIVKRHI